MTPEYLSDDAPLLDELFAHAIDLPDGTHADVRRDDAKPAAPETAVKSR